MSAIIVAGATSQVGRFVLPMLASRDHQVTAISRHQPTFSHGVRWVQADIAREMTSEPGRAEVLIGLAPLGVIVEALKCGNLPATRRVIAFSSTAVVTKRMSSDSMESLAAKRLLAAEAELRQYCDRHSIAWTLFRPTMIYDGQNDKNVALIARFIGRFGFFPLVGKAQGRRQPVHAGDLAWACATAIDKEETFNRIYNLAGGEVLTYREMVDRIFGVLGKRPLYLHIPSTAFRAAIKVGRSLPRYRYLSAGMVERMEMDMVFDCRDAERDFSYRGRRFDP